MVKTVCMAIETTNVWFITILSCTILHSLPKEAYFKQKQFFEKTKICLILPANVNFYEKIFMIYYRLRFRVKSMK